MVDEKTEKPPAGNAVDDVKVEGKKKDGRSDALAAVAEVLDASSNFMCLVDDGDIVYVNEAGVEALDYDAKKSLTGKHFGSLFALDEKERNIKNIEEGLKTKSRKGFVVSMVCSDGKQHKSVVSVRGLPKFGENSFVLEAKMIDANEGKNSAESFVLHDALTGLPALPLFEDRLEMAIARATRAAHGRPESAVQLLVTFSVDMDKAKDIDIAYGKDAKAYILNTMSSRLVSSFRRVDTIARGDHDGFLIFLENINSLDDVEMIARRIMGLVKEGINYKDQNLALGCSIGISVFPHGALTVDEMIKQANTALDQVKKKGGDGYAIYKSK